MQLLPVIGFLVVLARPKPTLDLNEFHNWYNTEHGPLRMKLGFFAMGNRYRSRELEPPLWLAAYDVTNLASLEDPRYIALRKNRSAREMNLIDNELDLLNRRIYKTLSTLGESNGPAPVIMAVAFVVKESLIDELHFWDEQVGEFALERSGRDLSRLALRLTLMRKRQEHSNEISRIPGWRRSRLFELVSATDQKQEGYVEVLAIHDFDERNGLGGPEHEHAKSKTWRHKILQLVESRDLDMDIDMAVFDLFHSFDAGNYVPPLPNPILLG